jgi:hypothetical protein
MMEKHTGSKLYTAITTIWHCRYLVRYKNMPHFTYVVRLLKDWKKEQDVPLKNIHLELMVADAYGNIIENIDNIGEIDDVLSESFSNILNTLDGYPVIPSNWHYCNVNNYEEKYNLPVLIDPANPNDNLLKEITREEIKIIKRKIKITMENLNNGFYADIFNRKGLTKYFD